MSNAWVGRGRVAAWLAALLAGAAVCAAAASNPFDGAYTGTQRGTAGCQGHSVGETSTFALTVIDGNATFTAPWPGTGTVSASGAYTGTVSPTGDPNAFTCATTGTLTNSGGAISGSGAFSCNGSCSSDDNVVGSWTASRVSGSCTAAAGTLCIANSGDDTFYVTVHYYSVDRDLNGDATAVSLNNSGITLGGAFAFFETTNPEMLVKVINGCALNSSYWVFIAAVTDVGYGVTVRDTVTGAVKTYSNVDHSAAAPVQDTSTFPCS